MHANMYVLDQGKEIHGLKAIAVVMMGAIFATTVSLRYTFFLI